MVGKKRGRRQLEETDPERCNKARAMHADGVYFDRIRRKTGISIPVLKRILPSQDLPDELNIRGMPRMAWNDCYLEKVKKDGSGSSAKWVWKINLQRKERWS